MPQVSIIIPAFRPMDFEALTRTMSDNALTDTEWIVVDDGSGPEFDAVFASLPAGVTVIRQAQNRRQGAARNIGLALAQGQWIKFLDADDRLDAGHLSALLTAGEQGPARGIPFAATKHLFANGTTHVNDSWRDLPIDSAAQLRRQLVRPFLHHCGALFPRDLLEQLGGYDEGLITDEDGDLLLRVLKAGYHFVLVERVHYLYIHHSLSPRVSTDDDIAKMHARIRVCDKFEMAWGHEMPDDVAHALAQRMDKIATTYWPTFYEEARMLLNRAEHLSPGYVPDMPATLRLARRLGGLSMVSALRGIYRRFKRRPKGGAQG